MENESFLRLVFLMRLTERDKYVKLIKSSVEMVERKDVGAEI